MHPDIQLIRNVIVVAGELQKQVLQLSLENVALGKRISHLESRVNVLTLYSPTRKPVGSALSVEAVLPLEEMEA